MKKQLLLIFTLSFLLFACQKGDPKIQLEQQLSTLFKSASFPGVCSN